MPNGCADCEFISECFMRFMDMPDTKFERLHTTRVKYARRQTLCKEGEFSSSIKLILSGHVLVMVEGPGRKNIIVKILSSGDFLGVSAICGEDTYAFSAIALTDTLVCSIGRDAVVSLLMHNGEFALKLAKWYCSNNTTLFRKLKDIGFKNQRGRMADAILYLELEEFQKAELYKYLTRKDIADIAGIPMESAVRILSEFNESEMISVKGKEIKVLKEDLLRKIRDNG